MTRSKSLLLVSRDPLLKEEVARALGLAGLPPALLSVASCGQEGLEILARDRPRLLILDDELPDTTGLELLGHLYRSGIKVLVVYLATHHTLELERAVRQCGVLYYTEKPPDFQVMTRIVAAALDLTGKEGRP